MSTETPDPRSAETGPDDLALLRRYARDRDSEAMAELFERHSDLAYRAALRVLRDPSEAQDAVQSAFVRIMQSVPAYRGGEGVRSWIMQIVMNTARDMIRSAVRRRHREEMTAGETAGPGDAGPDRGLELAGRVRDLLDRLPERYRLPIWLHHYEGMPFAEVAEVLEAPENTVRSHANRGLEELRLRLARSGFAVPSVSILGVLAAIPAEGTPAPLLASLRDIAAGAGQFAGAAALADAPGAGQSAAAGGQATVPWLKIAAGVALITGAAVVTREALDNRTPESGPVLPPSAIAPATTPAAGGKILFQCDFNSPAVPAAFKVMRGSWRHVPGGGPDGSGCMEIDSMNSAVTLDVSIESLPVLVSYSVVAGQTTPPIQDYMTCFAWDRVLGDTASLEGLTAVVRETPQGPEQLGAWRATSEYVTERWIDRWIDGSRHHTFETGTKGPTSRLTLYTRGRHRIDNLVVRTISPSELPDVQRLLAALEEIPPEKRVGKVMLPKLNPPGGSRQAFVRFLSGK